MMFKQALNEWADKTANFYHKLAVENPSIIWRFIRSQI